MSETRPGQERFVAPIDETPLRAIDAVNVDAVPENQWKEAWKRLRTSPLFWLATTILVVVALMIFFPSLFTSADPNKRPDLMDSFAPARKGHPFGFTEQGGDVWARTIAGFYGGIVDTLVSRFSDIFFSIPLLLACIVVISVLNNIFPERGFWGSVLVVVAALSTFAWPQITRQMRGAVLEIKNLEFVDAATAIGASKMKNLRRHIVPNALAPVIVASTISLGVFIVAESSLSFLGLGLPTNVVSWGNDISAAATQVRSGQNLQVMFVPAAALAFTVLGFILLGEAVREALDPKARKK
jgi:oligopeptide transport system permease protein